MQTMKEKLEKLQKGSIIETITNSNGTAIKFADGTMICRKTVTFNNIDITTKKGSFFVTENLALGNWAEKFIGKPDISATKTNGWAGIIYQYTSYNDTSARCSCNSKSGRSNGI